MRREGIKLVANNREAYFDCFIDGRYEAGIELLSTKVKSTRIGKCNVKESSVKVDRGKVYVCGMHVSPYEKGNVFNKDPLHVRELLLRRYEILKIGGKIKEKGYTLVPLRVCFKGSLVKVEIGLARSEKNYDKRADIARKDQRRELEKDFKVKNLYQERRKVPCDVDMGRYLEFIKEVKGPESTLRTAWTATGRQEGMAKYSWRLALGAAVLCYKFPELDRKEIVFMYPVRDLGELYTGSVSTALRPDEGEKHRQKQLNVSRATRTISGPCAKEVVALCGEYDQDQASEARSVKAVGKAETIIQHSQDANPPDFDYEFNLSYGVEYFQENEKLEELRTLTDEEASEA